MSSSRLRSSTGMGTIELAASSFALLIMVLIAVDLAVLLIGRQNLDRSARDAARAAASQGTKDRAVLAAQAALALHKADGTFISNPTLTGTNAPDFVYNDFGGTPYDQVIPAGLPNAGQKAGNATVTVTTQVTVLLPASFGALGVRIDQGPLTGGKMDFQRTYTFPIVRQQLDRNFR